MSVRRGSRLRFTALIALFAPILAVLLSGSTAAAHDSTDGSVVAVIDERRVVVTAPVEFDELGYADTSDDGLLDADELAAQEATVAPTLVVTARNEAAISVDGETVEIIGAGVPSLGESDDEENAASPYVTLVLATGPHDGDVSEVEMTWEFSGPNDTVVLSSDDGAVTSQLSEESTVSFTLDGWSSAVSFFKLGVDHIQYGPDHLLFLLVLTLAAAGTTVTASTTWRTIKLVTAFTVGHAISLGLAYFEVISVPASIVEPAIAMSIVVAAVMAIRGVAADARLWLAGLVGVIHGLGFASNLDSLGVATSQRIAALAAFNIGIDIAQTVVVLMVLGVLWLCTQLLDERTRWVRYAGATYAAMFGILWTATRLAELSV